MSGVWLPSLGQILAWCAHAAAVVVALAVAVWVWLGRTGRRWQR